MSSTSEQKNGRGKPRKNAGRRPSMMRSAAEIALNERVRLRLVRIVDTHGVRPSRMVQEIIEGRHTPFCTPARRTLELIQADFPTEEVKAVMLDEYARWIDEQAAKRHLLPAA